MSKKQTDVVQNGGRWVRVGVMAFTTLAPMVNMLLERMRLAALREQEQQAQEQLAESEQEVEVEQSAAPRSLNDLTSVSRQFVAEQAQQLQKQARTWQAQAKQLRKALRQESKRRRRLNKMVKRLRAVGIDWSQEMLKRSEGLTEGMVSQGSKISQDLLERGGKLSHELTERGGELSQDLVKRGGELGQDWVKRGNKASRNLTKRGGKLTRNLTKRGGKLTHELTERGGELSHDLLKQGSKVTHDLAERGETLLQPIRQRKGTFWTVFGFSLGLVAAAIVTYVFVRNRLAQQLAAEEQQIELAPRESAWSGNGIGSTKPAGEIHHLDSNGTSVATLHSVGVQQAQQVEAPADASFVGIVSAKTYYPLETPIDAKDLVYFASEEEAQAEGFTAAVL